MSKPIKCGIIGCGVIAPTHALCYRQLEDVQVAWACDLVEAKARRLAERFEIPRVTTDYRQVFADPEVDLVSVCTDHASHSPLAVAALEAGKHVVCEKALAASHRGLTAMIEAHRRFPKQVFAGIFQHRHDPINQYLKRLIEEGAFGTILTAGVQMRCLRTPDYYNADEWRGTWAHEGGAVLINQAIHYIDLLQWTMGGVAAVSGTFANLTHRESMETEDTAVASLRFRNGALGTLDATCSSNLDWEPTLSYHGSEGSLDLRHDRIMKVSFRNQELGARIAKDIATITDVPPPPPGKLYYGSGHPAQLADVVAAVREGRAPFVTAESARHTVDLVLSIYESHRKQTWIELPHHRD